MFNRLHTAIQRRLLNLSLRRFERQHRLEGGQPEREMGRVAVVVPCYNHAPYLPEALRSLERQSYRPFEVVCVDDCSADETAQVLEAWQPPEGITKTVLRPEHNLGQAAAINRVVEQSQADLFVILNDDDYLMHDAIEAGVALLRRYPQAYLLGAECVVFSGKDNLTAQPEDQKRISTRFHDYTAIPVRVYEPAEALRFRQPKDLSITHSGMMFFQSAWQASGGYYSDKRQRVTIHTDRDFQMRVAALLPVAVTYHAQFAFWREDSSVDRGVYS
jgi:glycosyltransferase involved in cell wall biosynthesis